MTRTEPASFTPRRAGLGETLIPYAPGRPDAASHPAWLDRVIVNAAGDPERFGGFPPPDGVERRESAVLLLFGPGPGPELAPQPTAAGDPTHTGGGESLGSVLLIERAHDMRSHPGQIALPGGGVEAGDADIVATALREAAEEVHLDGSGVEVLGTLPPMFIGPSSSLVTTVVGWWRDPSPVSVGDPAEVAQVIEAPLEFLLDPATRHTVVHPRGYRGPGFVLGDDLLLWGFTGSIVNAALELGGLTRAWDEQRTMPIPERLLWGRRG